MRAGTTHSVTLAVGALDRPHLSVAEAVVALASLAQERDSAAVSRAVGFPAEEMLQDLQARALLSLQGTVWEPIPTLREALPQPVAHLALDVPAPEGAPPAGATAADLGLSEPAQHMLQALVWRSPVGALPQDPHSDAAAAVAELRGAHLLVPHGAGRVALPGAIALDLRGGRTHRDVPVQAPTPPADLRAAETIRAEAALAGEEAVRHLEDLLAAWARRPAPALRSGGVGVREVHRTAEDLGLRDPEVALLVELAAADGLLGTVTDEDGLLWAPTHAEGGEAALGADADADPERDPVAVHWAGLVTAWWHSDRAVALVGTRARDGALRSALEPGLERGWARTLRASVLGALRAWPVGSAPSAAEIADHLAWDRPVTPPPDWALQAVLSEAAFLGLTAAGALSEVGRALLDETPTLIEACTHCLPPTVDQLVLQADLTAVVPGRPSAALRALLRQCAQTESRGGALTVRFTPRSLDGALRAGAGAADLLERLRAVSLTPVPQPLEYAIGDAQRRLGSLRAGAAAAYLRTDDPAELTALLAHRDLDLRLLAPTVAISHHHPTTLAHLVAEHGVTARMEGADGTVLDLETRRTTATTPMPRPRTESSSRVSPEAREQAVRAMREGEERAGFTSGGEVGGDPSVLRARLNAAVRTATPVVLAIADSDGTVLKRRVLPLRVSAGSVLGRDLERATDLTVAIHRLLDVAT